MILLVLLVAAGPVFMPGGTGSSHAEHKPGARPPKAAPLWQDGGRDIFRRPNLERRRPVYKGNGKRRPNQRRQNRRSEQDRARDAVRRGQALPLADIVGGLQNRCPGVFLEATLLNTQRGLAYRVRILRPSGRRITLLVDAGSGRVVRGRCR
jgi:hypothetical protein